MRTGSISIAVKGVSVPSRGLGADSGGTAPVWARVVTSASSEPWIQESRFSTDVGWRVDPASDASEDGTEEEKAPLTPFTFWPPPAPELLPEDFPEGTDVEEGAEIPRKDESWSWSAVAEVMPDKVRDAPADAAASVWEETLASLSDEDIARANIEYMFQNYNGASPTRSGPIPLTRSHITAVLNTSIVVEVYRGSERNPEADALVGRAVFGTETWDGTRLVGAENSLARVLTYAAGIDVVLPVESPPADEASEANLDEESGDASQTPFSEPVSVILHVQASESLVSFCRGGRVFTCLAGGIPMLDSEGAVPIPEIWKIPCTESEVKESDGTWEALEFTVDCAFPAYKEESTEGKEPELIERGEVGLLKGGKGLSFPYVESNAEDMNAEDDETTTPAALQADSSTLAVSWSSSAHPATLMRTFVTRAEVESLISKGKNLTESNAGMSTPEWSLTVSRSLFDGEASNLSGEGGEDTQSERTPTSTPPPLASKYTVSVPLISSLTVPGVAHILSRCEMTDLNPSALSSAAEDSNDVEEEEEEEGDPPKRMKSLKKPELIVYAQFNSPLVVAPPPPPEPKLMPSDLIPARPAPALAPAVSAVKVLRDEVRSAANSIVSEIYALYGDDMKQQQASQSGSGQEGFTVEQRRRRLLYHLNTSGAYNTLRDRLKHSMGRLVKEKFPAESSLASDSIEHGKFISELYVFLMEEVFSVLNDMFTEAAGGVTVEENNPNPKAEAGENKAAELIGPDADSAKVLSRLGALATEAELAGDMELAARYHQDRVIASEEAASRSNVREVPGGGYVPWLEYARFSARMGDYDKAEESCREAISLSLPVSSSQPGKQSGDANPEALLMQSALLCRRSDLNKAKVMLSPLIESQDAIAGTMLSIVHLRCEKETIKAEKAILAAIAASGESSTCFDLYHNLATKLVHHGFADLADFTLSIAAKKGRPSRVADDADSSEKNGEEEGKSSAVPEDGNDESIAWEATNMSRAQRVRHLWLSGAVSMTLGNLNRAEKLLKAAIEVEEACGEAWSVLGHVLALSSKEGNAAASAFQTALPLLEASRAVESPLPVAQLGQLYNSLGALYLKEGDSCQPGAAKEVFLRACQVQPTSTSWLGAGIAAMTMGSFKEAEDALSEANILNNQHPRIWGYLALLCATKGRIEEAEQALNQAKKLGIGDKVLLKKISLAYAEQGELRKSSEILNL